MLGNIEVYKKPKGVRFGGSDYAIYAYYDDKVKLADSIFCGGGSGETCMVYSGEKYILRLSHGGYDLNCYTKYKLLKDGRACKTVRRIIVTMVSH